MVKSKKFSMKDKKVIILGGSGFLGSAIARQLGKKAVIADITEPKSNIENEFVWLDLLGSSKLDEIINQFDVVINCAGQITSPINNCLSLNTRGVNRIIKSLNKFESIRFIHVSTVAVYGTVYYANEGIAVNPESAYSAAKAFAEFILTNYYKFKPCIIRIPNLYGDSQEKGILAYLKKSLLTDRKLNFDNNGSQLRYYIHVDDAAEAIIKAIEFDIAGIFNLSTNDRFTIDELISLISGFYQINFDVDFGSHEPDSNIENLDGTAFNSLTGFAPTKSLTTYIENML
jgi:nucleoside-diphosphate-sugar epimerase